MHDVYCIAPNRSRLRQVDVDMTNGQVQPRTVVFAFKCVRFLNKGSAGFGLSGRAEDSHTAVGGITQRACRDQRKA